MISCDCLTRKPPQLFLSTMRHTDDSDFLQVARAIAVDAWRCQSREQNPVSSDEDRVSSGAVRLVGSDETGP